MMGLTITHNHHRSLPTKQRGRESLIRSHMIAIQRILRIDPNESQVTLMKAMSVYPRRLPLSLLQRSIEPRKIRKSLQPHRSRNKVHQVVGTRKITKLLPRPPLPLQSHQHITKGRFRCDSKKMNSRYHLSIVSCVNTV